MGLMHSSEMLPLCAMGMGDSFLFLMLCKRKTYYYSGIDLHGISSTLEVVDIFKTKS